MERGLIDFPVCDADFAQHLADIGGVNYNGDPIFRIVWAAAETMSVLSPEGIYEDEHLSNDPIWVLQRWAPPESFGTPELHNMLMADPETGLPLTPYPEFGMYVDVIAFKFRRVENNELKITTIPLDWELIEHAVPIMLQVQEMTFWERKAAIQADKDLRKKAELDRLTDQMLDALPSFYGPVSLRDQQNRTALIDREVAKIEAQWKRFSPLFKKNMPRGFQATSIPKAKLQQWTEEYKNRRN